MQLESGGLVGDPLERATLLAIGWGFNRADTAFPLALPAATGATNTQPLVKVLQRFHFVRGLELCRGRHTWGAVLHGVGFLSNVGACGCCAFTEGTSCC